MATEPEAVLVGPEWLLPDGERLIAAKLAICAEFGLSAVSASEPLAEGEAASGVDAALLRHEQAMALVARCPFLLANLTPFRGVGAEAGTVFLVGVAAALGRRIYGYSGEPRSLAARTPADGAGVEPFDLADAHGIDCACLQSGRPVLRPSHAARDPLRDLESFRRCVALLCRDQNIRRI